jgi:hypothetical protein
MRNTLLRRNPGFDVGFDHTQYIGGETSGNAHFFYFFAGFDRYTHKNMANWLLRIRDYGIKRAPSATARQNKSKHRID